MKKASKKKDLEKCYVCTHSYKAEEIDEHMNGMTHHFVLEQLYKKSRPHHCLVCGCLWKGLKLYRQHVATPEHKQKIAELVKKRRTGTNVPLTYTTTPELINLCKERDQQNIKNKAKRKQEKQRARKAKQLEKAFASKRAKLSTTNQHGNKENKNSSTQSRDDEHRGRSASPHSPTGGVGSSPARSLCAEPHDSSPTTAPTEPGSSVQGVVATSTRQAASHFFSEIDFGLDFTCDMLPPVGAVLFASAPGMKAETTKSKAKSSSHSTVLSSESEAKQEASLKGKRSHRTSVSRKRPLSQCEGSPSTSADNRQEEVPPSPPPRAPGLVQAHVRHISTILRRIRRSLDEEGLPNHDQSQPSSTPFTGDSADGNEKKQSEHSVKKLKTEHHGDGCSHEEGTSCCAFSSSPSSATEKPESACAISQSSVVPEHEDEVEAPRSGSREYVTDQASLSQNRPGLSELLRRDLSRLGAKSGAHEPNLTAARRIRTISSSQAGEAEKEGREGAGPGLKPTLEKLINSTAAKRKVNWKELLQQYHRNKRQREKGMPRFGIELVRPVVSFSGDLHLEEVDDLQGAEEFPWDSINFDTSCPPADSSEGPPPYEDPYPELPPAGQVTMGAGLHRPTEVVIKTEKNNWGFGESQVPPPPETTSKGKEDRPDQAKPRKESQVDELLAVSLREEELNSSLLTLEGDLTQAWNALQAAYVEVQRLLVVRDQTANDINALRAKRIEILRVMRGKNFQFSSNRDIPCFYCILGCFFIMLGENNNYVDHLQGSKHENAFRLYNNIGS
ncbi:hypothetical protein ACEWY4_022495 [Coilia grayii]|uniref:Uncharacterized protein n=1 Tax=Coilia grayii TaxID=363190 RepID=A0ABD1J6A0_9TELE